MYRSLQALLFSLLALSLGTANATPRNPKDSNYSAINLLPYRLTNLNNELIPAFEEIATNAVLQEARLCFKDRLLPPGRAEFDQNRTRCGELSVSGWRNHVRIRFAEQALKIIEWRESQVREAETQIRRLMSKAGSSETVYLKYRPVLSEETLPNPTQVSTKCVKKTKSDMPEDTELITFIKKDDLQIETLEQDNLRAQAKQKNLEKEVVDFLKQDKGLFGLIQFGLKLWLGSNDYLPSPTDGDTAVNLVTYSQWNGECPKNTRYLQVRMQDQLTSRTVGMYFCVSPSQAEEKVAAYFKDSYEWLRKQRFYFEKIKNSNQLKLRISKATFNELGCG